MLIILYIVYWNSYAFIVSLHTLACFCSQIKPLLLLRLLRRYRATFGLGSALDEHQGTICSGAAAGPKKKPTSSDSYSLRAFGQA